MIFQLVPKSEVILSGKSRRKWDTRYISYVYVYIFQNMLFMHSDILKSSCLIDGFTRYSIVSTDNYVTALVFLNFKSYL